MKITFLGTAAATSYPLAFCRCKFCIKARELGEKDFRKRASIIINDDLLIDMGPDVVSASLQYKKFLTDIRYCLQTHSHSDHFDASHLSTRIPEYMGVDTPPLKMVASEATFNKMSEMMRGEGYINDLFDQTEKDRLNIEVVPVKPLEDIELGKYKISAFASEHDASIESLIYTVTQDNFTILYATDTDVIPNATWQGFLDKKCKFNVVILDHTYGPNADSGGHLNANRFIETIKKMKDENLLADNARILATHISHEGNPTHDELSKYASEHGYEIAFDGLVI